MVKNVKALVFNAKFFKYLPKFFIMLFENYIPSRVYGNGIYFE